MSNPFAPTCADCGAVLFLGECRECNGLDDAGVGENGIEPRVAYRVSVENGVARLVPVAGEVQS